MPNVRLTWQNNSTGHDGQRVRMDEPSSAGPDTVIADIGPAVEEYIALNATEPEACFTVAAYDAGAEEESGVACVETNPGATDWGSVSVGDYIEGGVYAGIITYTDARQFHIIFGVQDSEVTGLQWGNRGVLTGASDPDDGKENQVLVLGSFDNGDSDAFYHCRDYSSDGHSDFYLPSRNESHMAEALYDLGHPEFTNDSTVHRWTSTENNDLTAWIHRYSDGAETFGALKDGTFRRTRPIRRVPV